MGVRDVRAYRLDGLLGCGGMGEVYRAFDTSHNRMVALKLLPDNLSADEEFRRNSSSSGAGTEPKAAVARLTPFPAHVPACREAWSVGDHRPDRERGRLRLLQLAVLNSTTDWFAIAPLIGLDLDAPLSVVAGMASAYFLAYGLMQPVWGMVSDRIGRVRVMRIALVSAAVAGAGLLGDLVGWRAVPAVTGAAGGLLWWALARLPTGPGTGGRQPAALGRPGAEPPLGPRGVRAGARGGRRGARDAHLPRACRAGARPVGGARRGW